MADDLAEMFDVPEDPAAKQRTITEELLAIVEDFGDYIEKFMFEIVTFLAVIDSSMGLMKDVLAMFGFEGWTMAFFPSFSFIVTMSVFLFGTKKRKTKREAEEAGGLGQALEMFEDVMDVMDDVVSVVEDMDEDDPTGGTGAGPECPGNDGQEESGPVDSTSVDNNKAKIRKVLSVVMLVGGVVAKQLRKRKNDEAGNEAGTLNEQPPGALSGGNALEVASDSVIGLGKTGGQVSMLTLETCNATTINSNSPAGGALHNASREANQVPAFAKRESILTSQQGYGKQSDATSGNKDRGSASLTEISQREGLVVGGAVGKRASRFQQLGAANMAGIAQGTAGIAQGTAGVAQGMAGMAQGTAGMAQGTAQMAGSLSSGAAQAATQGAKKSGGLIPLVVRFVRIIVRVVNRGKGKEEKPAEKAESSKGETNNTGASEQVELRTGVKGYTGSLTSLNNDGGSIYYDCESHFTSVEVHRQTSLGRAFSKTSVVSAGTQTEAGSSWSLHSPWQSQVRLQELENRVLELEAVRLKNREEGRTGDASFSAATAGGDPEVQRVEEQTSWSPDRYRSRDPRTERMDDKSGILERNKGKSNEVRESDLGGRREWQNPTNSGLIVDSSSEDRSVRGYGRSEGYCMDTRVVVHRENHRGLPKGANAAKGYLGREQMSGRTNYRGTGEAIERVRLESAINTSSLEEFEGAHSHTERSALSLSSVRFVDEIRPEESTRRHPTPRHGRDGKNTLSKAKRRNSLKSIAREDNSYRGPPNNALEKQRFVRSQFEESNPKWNRDRWTSDICLTGRQQSSGNYFPSGKNPRRIQERCSSERFVLDSASGLVGKPSNSTKMMQSPSMLHRSQSSCFGDDESL